MTDMTPTFYGMSRKTFSNADLKYLAEAVAQALVAEMNNR